MIIEHKHCHILLFLVASSSLPYHTLAQSATQPVAPCALHEPANPSLVVLVSVTVFVFFVAGFCSIYLRHCSENPVVAGNPVGAGGFSRSPPGINPEVLATFPMLVYSTIKDHKMGKFALQCAVCLNEFRDCETLRLLPKCSHVFHPDCIDAWLASHVTCPVCRAKLKPDGGEAEVVIGDLTNAHHVFDESSEEQPAEVNTNEGRGSGNAGDGCVGKINDGSSKVRAFGVLVRSHSTGHSLPLVEPGKNFELERYTLRLPEEVRKQILDDEHGSMRRSASCDVVFQSEGCSRKGWGRCDGERSNKGKKDDGFGLQRQWQNWWVVSMRMTPPFVSRAGSSTCSGIPRFWASSPRPLLPL